MPGVTPGIDPSWISSKGRPHSVTPGREGSDTYLPLVNRYKTGLVPVHGDQCLKHEQAASVILNDNRSWIEEGLEPDAVKVARPIFLFVRILILFLYPLKGAHLNQAIRPQKYISLTFLETHGDCRGK